VTHRFTIRILPDRAPDFFTSGVTYEVQAMDLDRPWLRVRLRVRQYRDDETAELRLERVMFRTSVDPGDSAPGTLTDLALTADWWKALFAEVLEHVTFHSPAIDRDEGLLHYGWEGEDIFNTVDFDTEVTTVPRAEGSAAESPRRGPQRPAMEVDGAAVDELMQEIYEHLEQVDADEEAEDGDD
jgi:hypothetical protein